MRKWMQRVGYVYSDYENRWKMVASEAYLKWLRDVEAWHCEKKLLNSACEGGSEKWSSGRRVW
jgi:hypothetical protein